MKPRKGMTPFERFYDWNYRDIDMSKYNIDKFDLGVAFAFGRKSAEAEMKSLRKDTLKRMISNNDELDRIKAEYKKLVGIKDLKLNAFNATLNAINKYRAYPEQYKRRNDLFSSIASRGSLIKDLSLEFNCTVETIKKDLAWALRFFRNLRP